MAPHQSQPQQQREQPTVTSRLQRRVEEDVAELYGRLLLGPPQPQQQNQQQPTLPPLPLARRAHARFLRAALGPLPAGFASLDASRCWIVYWAVHGLALLGHELAPGDEEEEDDEGGGGGGGIKREDDDDDGGAEAGPSSSPSRRAGRLTQRHHNQNHHLTAQPRTSSPIKAPKTELNKPPKAKGPPNDWFSPRFRRGCGRRPRSPLLTLRADRPPRPPRDPDAPKDEYVDDDGSSSDESTPLPSEDGYDEDEDSDGGGGGAGGAGGFLRGEEEEEEQDDDDDDNTTTPSAASVIRFLRACQSPTGGFGGGPGQRPHLAPTYAAVAALVSLNHPRAWRALDRPALRSFLLRCADEARNRFSSNGLDGGSTGFAMHEGGGEVDARSCYTALAAAELAGLDVLELASRSGALEFFARCQTYEGGCGGEPGNEAHGGYGYCAAAGCAIVRRAAERVGDRATADKAATAVDARSALRWAALRQGWVEGGFSGRTNKLADGCYSFWVGAMFPLLQEQVAWLKGRGLWERESGGGGSGNGNNHDDNADLDALIASVPPLPRAIVDNKTRPPLEAAQAAAAQAKQRAADATAAALQAGAAMATGGGEDEEQEDPRAAAALDRAARARAAETRALADVKLAERSAALLVGAGEEDGEDSNKAASASASASASAAAAAAAAAPFPPSLCNPRALALWVLIACQPAAASSASLRRARGGSPEPANANNNKGKESKRRGNGGAGAAPAAPAGGLRDKPGKPADFYHTCYCLSGLAAATQWRQEEQEEDEDKAAVLRRSAQGEDARLARADPALNVLVSRARAAREFWTGGGGAAVKMEEE